MFVDDNDPQKSFTLNRGRIRNYTTEKGEILVELERPAFDQPGTQSNVRITVVDPANATALTQWIGLPVERSRSVTTYSTDVRHDHKGKGECNGKLLADDTMLRFEVSLGGEPFSNLELQRPTELSRGERPLTSEGYCQVRRER